VSDKDREMEKQKIRYEIIYYLHIHKEVSQKLPDFVTIVEKLLYFDFPKSEILFT
jgi:hypothetical protein